LISIIDDLEATYPGKGFRLIDPSKSGNFGAFLMKNIQSGIFLKTVIKISWSACSQILIVGDMGCGSKDTRGAQASSAASINISRLINGLELMNPDEIQVPFFSI
jgi:hypothetical protein